LDDRGFTFSLSSGLGVATNVGMERRDLGREHAGHESEDEARRAGGGQAEGTERGAPKSAEDLAVERVNADKADERERRKP
jgi:hypothetical protein